MEILRLDSSTYYPDELIEDYSSMIWTERKLEAGEFELKTSVVGATKELLPEGSLLSHVDTEEVMIVESHSIQKDSADGAELTIKGRSFETFAENRNILPLVHGEEWATLKMYTSAELAMILLWNSLANDTGQDALRDARPWDPINRVDNLLVTDSTDLVEEVKSWMLKDGEVYKPLVDFLTLGKLGIRTIRPSGTAGSVVSVNVTDDRGRIDRTPTADISQLRVDVYTGADRSVNQPFLEPVVFRYDAGDIEDPKYVMSIREYKNLAIVSSTAPEPLYVWADTGLIAPDPIPTGLDLRILHVDGGDYVGVLYEDYIASATQKAQIELAKHNRAVLFDGAISESSPNKYNQEYFLGDKVTLVAEYDFEATMEVVEYVRTEDQSGDRGYPTLVLAE